MFPCIHLHLTVYSSLNIFRHPYSGLSPSNSATGHISLSPPSSYHSISLSVPQLIFPMSGLHTRRHLGRRQPSILCASPSHLHLLRMNIISTLSRPAKDLNSVFLVLSHRDTPRITPRHPMMKACRSLKRGARGTHVSLP